jgi:hypothetical protein
LRRSSTFPRRLLQGFEDTAGTVNLGGRRSKDIIGERDL